MPLPKITSAMLVLTHNCNLACPYCFVTQEPSRMSYDIALRSARFLADNAEASGTTPYINFFGGEPMILYEDVIVPLTNWIRKEYKKPFKLGMTTNGTLLTTERIKFLKDNDFGLLFSLDGAKATQDKNRPYHDGRGSFDVLAPIIPQILANWPTMTLRMTVVPPTCEHLFENILWGETQGYTNFFAMPNNFEEWTPEKWEVLVGEVRKYTDYYIDCYRTPGKKPMLFSTFEDAFRDIKAINAAEKALTYRTGAKCSACGKCGLGANTYASIHPDGSIYGCQEMTSNGAEDNIFYIGNLTDGVDDARRYALMLAYDRERVKGDGCETCPLDRVCDGGCVANNWLNSGKLTEMPKFNCRWKRLLLEEATRVMQTLGAEGNARFKEHWATIKG